MTSHFDRYHSIKPAFPNIDNYTKFFETKQKQVNKDGLLKEAKTAVAWGTPDNESLGYSRETLIDIIRRLVKYIETTAQ
jgi:hypothetical protein